MRRGLQIRARKPAGSVGFSFAFVGRGDPLILLLAFKAVLFGRAGNLAAHRRSNLLSDFAHNRNSGFSITPAPVKGLNARGPLKVHPRMASLAGDLCAGADRSGSATGRPRTQGG
jgi:hypothetical protein